MKERKVLTKDLFDCDVPFLQEAFADSKYPWELIPKIHEIIEKILPRGLPGYHLWKEGVLVGENVMIADNATILPPAIIGHGSLIRPGAYLRGDVIVGDECVVGHGSELKNCILLPRSIAPHYNYVGDSILGKGTHLGASSICSNLRGDKKPVIIHGDLDFITNLVKLGAMIGDDAEIGCGSVLNPGTIVGKNSQVYPLSNVRGVLPCDSIYKDKDHIVAKEERT